MRRQSCFEMADICGLTGRINDQQKTVFAPSDHQVIEYPALVVRELRIARCIQRQATKIARDQSLKRCDRIIPPDLDLSHMRNIEQSGGSPRVKMLLQNSGLVLYRHIIARKCDELPAQLDMQRVQRCPG